MLQELGKLLSDLRKEKGLTQQDLANKLFVSNKTVSKWENGNTIPDIDILIDLSNLYGVPLDVLLLSKRDKNDDISLLIVILIIINCVFSVISYLCTFFLILTGFGITIVVTILGINIILSLVVCFLLRKKNIRKIRSNIILCFYFNILSIVIFILLIIGCLILS